MCDPLLIPDLCLSWEFVILETMSHCALCLHVEFDSSSLQNVLNLYETQKHVMKQLYLMLGENIFFVSRALFNHM